MYGVGQNSLLQGFDSGALLPSSVEHIKVKYFCILYSEIINHYSLTINYPDALAPEI